MSVETKKLSKEISEFFWREGFTLATAESCTAGNVPAVITAIPGSSRFYKGGIVAYANEVKQSLLHVSQETLEKYGAVSEETVVEMVKGVMETLGTDYAVATSGIAGPAGGTPENLSARSGWLPEIKKNTNCQINGRRRTGEKYTGCNGKTLQLLLDLCQNQENEH